MANYTSQQASPTPDTFEGFVPPTRNYFMMPNEWTDITAEIDSLAELKVVEYVLRHTWGFHEFGICKTISIDEFMYGRKFRSGEHAGKRMDKGTGLKSDRSVRDGINLAIAHGYLVCEVNGSDQARIKKSYKLKMRENNNNLPPRVVDTTTMVDTTGGKHYQSDPSLLPVGAVDTTNRSKKDTKEIHFKKERETPPVLPTAPQRDSPSLPPEKSSLHAKLTDQEVDFWSRWCAIAKSPELNETAYPHVVVLATELTSTADLQSLYDFEYDQLREFAKAKGKGEPLPPRLGNLIKALPEWRQTQVRHKQEKEQDQEAHEHIPGSGSITNWTQARLAGNQPAINYEQLPPVHKIPKDLKRIGNVASALSPGLQERIKQAREKRQTEA